MYIVLTGHSQGLGAALAANLLERGHHLLGISRRKNPTLSQRYPQHLAELELDLAQTDRLISWLSSPQLGQFLASGPEVCLINNAGTLDPIGKAGTYGDDLISTAVGLNLTAAMVLANQFIRLSAAASDRRLIHLSSGAARNAYAGWSVYCATKAALDQHARCLAAENHAGLRICSLAPGMVDTAMQDKARSAEPGQFPMHSRFEKAKKEGTLIAPMVAAQAIAQSLFSDAFGTEICRDLRYPA